MQGQMHITSLYLVSRPLYRLSLTDISMVISGALIKVNGCKTRQFGKCLGNIDRINYMLSAQICALMTFFLSLCGTLSYNTWTNNT